MGEGRPPASLLQFKYWKQRNSTKIERKMLFKAETKISWKKALKINLLRELEAGSLNKNSNLKFTQELNVNIVFFLQNDAEFWI